MRYMDELCAQGKGKDVRAMQIIGLTGKAGSGKSSVAEILKETGFSVYSLADEIKSSLIDLDPLIPSGSEVVRLSTLLQSSDLETLKRTHPEVRRLMQVLGSEVIRSRDDGFWISQLQQKIVTDYTPKVVITDVRFANEAHWVRQGYRSMVICIQRPSNPDEIQGTSHQSEHGLPPELIDHTIINDGSMDYLRKAVLELDLGGSNAKR